MNKPMAFFLIIYLLLPSICFADKIQGHACYTYGDNESLVQAEHTAKMLAIRNAIESNTIFIESTSQITNFQLTQDLLQSVSVGQVQGVKVLKRIESGRTLCYTVEGFVNPQEMQTAIKDYLSKKSSDVQLQDNGWVRIVSEFVEEESYEEFYKRQSVPISKLEKGRKIRRLNVKIQFLKACQATTRELKFSEEFMQSAKTGQSMPPENQAMFLLGLTARITQDGKLKEEEKQEQINKMMKEYHEFCSRNGIDGDELLMDLSLPRFRCDYRIKVFATFLSPTGFEMETDGIIPYALLIDSVLEKRKTEMLPGETTYVTFIIPENAKSWKVWVPK
jgi:hypothetical protein